MLLKKDEFDEREYYGDLTERLDQYAHIEGLYAYKTIGWKHYVYVSTYDIDEKCLAIRIPGSTLGCIDFDDNFIITDISINMNGIVKSYDRHTLKKIKKEFIGQKIEFDELPK